MNKYFDYLKQMILAFFRNVGDWFYNRFAYPIIQTNKYWTEYGDIFDAYAGDFGFWGWFFFVVFAILLVAFVGALVWLLVFLLGKYIKFYKKEVDKDKLIEEIETLQAELYNAEITNRKILGLQVASIGGGAAPAGGANGANGVDGTNATNGPASANIKLTADDQKVADFINNYLEEKDSPAAGQGAGEMMVKYGKEYDVDPLVLLSIAGQETNYGKAGIGVNGMLGVGAYDNDPNNATRNPAFSGVEMQIKRGAETFARLREKGGSSSDASIADQTAAVNKEGWATDQNWHNGVTQIYNQIANKAVDAGIAERVGGGAAELAKQFEGQTTYNIQGLDHLDKSIGYDLNCANFVSACLQNTGGIEGHYNNCTGLEAALQKQGYVQVSPDQAQPGDVWFNPQRGHTELVKEAGNPPVLIGSNNGGDNIQEVTTDRYSGRSGVFYHRN